MMNEVVKRECHFGAFFEASMSQKSAFFFFCFPFASKWLCSNSRKLMRTGDDADNDDDDDFVETLPTYNKNFDGDNHNNNNNNNNNEKESDDIKSTTNNVSRTSELPQPSSDKQRIAALQQRIARLERLLKAAEDVQQNAVAASVASLTQLNAATEERLAALQQLTVRSMSLGAAFGRSVSARRWDEATAALRDLLLLCAPREQDGQEWLNHVRAEMERVAARGQTPQLKACRAVLDPSYRDL